MSTAPTLPPLPAMYCGPDTGHVNIWLAEDLRAWGEACATAHTSALAQRVEALERDLAAMTTAHAVAVELGATYAARVDELRADAERYRWLKANCGRFPEEYMAPQVRISESYNYADEESIDREIDAARKGDQQHG